MILLLSRFSSFPMTLLLVLSLSACGGKSGDKSETAAESGNQQGLSDADKAQIYAATVHRLVNNGNGGGYCVACHANVTAPFFAAHDPEEAYKNVMDYQKINMEAPEQSRLVQRLRADSHNCWSDCAGDSDVMEAAVQEFVRQIRKREGESQQEENQNIIRTDEKKIVLPPAVVQSQIYEAENGELFSNNTNPSPLTLATNDADASGGEHLIRTGTNNDGGVRFKVQINNPGFYRFFYRVDSEGITDNNQRRFGVEISGPGLPSIQLDGRFAEKTDWAWQATRLNGDEEDLGAYYFMAQEYTFDIYFNGAVKFDQFAVSSDPTFQGSTFAPAQATQSLNYDLTNAMVTKYPDFKGKVFLAIDLEIKADGSYHFSNPRLLSSETPLIAKNMKFYYNGIYSSRYKTFEPVEKEIAAGSYEILLARALVVLAEETGDAAASFSFSFDELSPKP